MATKKDNPIPGFEKATKDFLDHPSQETYHWFINWFANVINCKSEVYAIVMIEDLPDYQDPVMRLNRITVGDKTFFAFFTSEKFAQKSQWDADIVKMSLDMVVELTLADERIAGLIVNPSDGKDASISSNMIRECYEAVKNYKG